MFRKEKPGRDANLQDFTAEYQRLVERMAEKAPERFPDGSPFYARAHLQNLANVSAHIYSLGWLDSADLCYRLALLMLEIGEADTGGPSIESAGSMLALRAALTEHGKPDELSVVESAGTNLVEFYRQTGALDRWSASDIDQDQQG